MSEDLKLTGKTTLCCWHEQTAEKKALHGPAFHYTLFCVCKTLERLPREVVDAPSLRVSTARWDEALSNLM